jgi:hypothetical protein
MFRRGVFSTSIAGQVHLSSSAASMFVFRLHSAVLKFTPFQSQQDLFSAVSFARRRGTASQEEGGASGHREELVGHHQGQRV